MCEFLLLYPRISSSLVQLACHDSINLNGGHGGGTEAQLHTVAPSSPEVFPQSRLDSGSSATGSLASAVEKNFSMSQKQTQYWLKDKFARLRPTAA